VKLLLVKKEFMSENYQKINKKAEKSGKIIALRNRFLFMFFRHANLIFLTSIVGLIISIIFLIIFIRQPIIPQYVLLNENGTYINLGTLADPKTDIEVNNFVAQGVKSLYRLDYIHYKEELSETFDAYFTKEGWMNYLKGLNDTGTLEFIKENKVVVSLNILSSPVITKKELSPQGIYTWEVSIKAQVDYFPSSSIQTSSLSTRTLSGVMVLKVVRASLLEHKDGLAISEFVFIEKK
jgi:hypothetical protein